MKTRRQERMEALIQKEISEVIEQELDVFEGYFATVTAVEISADFRTAKIFYSVIGDEEKKKSFIKKIHQNKSQIRFALGNRIKFRSVPLFQFEYDENVARAARIEDILINIKQNEKRDE